MPLSGIIRICHYQALLGYAIIRHCQDCHNQFLKSALLGYAINYGKIKFMPQIITRNCSFTSSITHHYIRVAFFEAGYHSKSLHFLRISAAIPFEPPQHAWGPSLPPRDPSPNLSVHSVPPKSPHPILSSEKRNEFSSCTKAAIYPNLWGARVFRMLSRPGCTNSSKIVVVVVVVVVVEGR